MELALIVAIEAESALPMHRQLYEQIRTAILTGKLRSHTKLPASRRLAKELGVSRTTITQSYDQLISEGYLLTRPGAGTFVCAQIPETFLSARLETAGALETSKALKTTEIAQTFTSAVDQSLATNQSTVRETNYRLSSYGQQVVSMPDRRERRDQALSFRYGIPDLEAFPIQMWRRLINRHQLNHTNWMGYSPDPMGYEPLRENLANYITQVRAVRCSPEQILITRGTQQALGLITRLLVNPGEAIALENPGYLSGRQIFSANGARLLPVDVDDQGLTISGPTGLNALANGLANTPPNGLAKETSLKVRLAYVTPSHQFPTGVLMSLSRRLALLEWAQQHNALIVEDDYDSEFRYSGRPIPALQGLDTSGRVLYVGTFSKILFPGLQIGYVVLPEPLIDVFKQAKWLCDRQCSLIHQAALADFIASGELAKHVRRMRPVYAERRQTLVNCLHSIERATGASIKILGDEAGLHIMTQAEGLHRSSTQSLLKQARAKGISLFSAQPHYDLTPTNLASIAPTPIAQTKYSRSNAHDSNAHEKKPPGYNELIFGFGAIDSNGIKAAFEKIADSWLALL